MNEKNHIHIHHYLSPEAGAEAYRAALAATGQTSKYGPRINIRVPPRWDHGVRSVNEFLAPIEAITQAEIQAWGQPRFKQLFDEFYASDLEQWELSMWLREQYCRSKNIGVDLTEQPSPALDPPPTTGLTLTPVGKPATGFVSWICRLVRRILL